MNGYFLIRQYNKKTLGMLGGRFCRSEDNGALFAFFGYCKVEPTELEFLPGIEIARIGANISRAITKVGTTGHNRPEAGGVGAARCVVLIGQAKIISIFVSKYAQAAIFRLNGVVTYPHANCIRAAFVAGSSGGSRIPLAIDTGITIVVCLSM